MHASVAPLGGRRGSTDIDYGVWSIFFGDILLAKLDEQDYIIRH